MMLFGVSDLSLLA